MQLNPSQKSLPRFWFLVLLLALPFSSLLFPSPLSSNNKIVENIPLNPESDGKVTNFLFTYETSERDQIFGLLRKYNAKHVEFFTHLPIGMVSFPENLFRELQEDHPAFASKIRPSSKSQVVPDLDQIFTVSQTSTYVHPFEIINATQLYQDGVTGEGAKIAILDTGIDTSHSAFANRVTFQKSFVTKSFGFSDDEPAIDLHGHGTHVAGLAVGSGTEYPGIAVSAEILNLKVADVAGFSTEEAVIAAIDTAINSSVDVISMSLGFSTASPWEEDDLLSLAVDEAVKSGISVVVSAGNDGPNIASISSPASASQALTVGATNGSDQVVGFSSKGPSYKFRVDPDIVAPGTAIIGPLASQSALKLGYDAIIGTSPSDYIALSGTSMAAPIVSGAVALLKQKFPKAPPQAIRAALLETGNDLGESVFLQGNGLIDVSSAAEALLRTSQSNPQEFGISASLPRTDLEKPLELSERIRFPGDNTTLKFSVITGMSGIVTWNISTTIAPFVTFDSSPDVLSSADILEKNLRISVPLDIDPGDYGGFISYTFRGIKKTFLVQFEIDLPKAKAIWPIKHTGREDSPFFNYRFIDGFLAENLSIDIDTYPGPLNWNSLSLYNLLILTDLEHPLSQYEISAIKKFHDNNGSIILVTSAFPYFNPIPYTDLAENLGLGIDFEDRLDLISWLDNGRIRNIVSLSPSELNISWEPSNSIFQNITTLPNLIGTGFQIEAGVPGIRDRVSVVDNQHSIFAAIELENLGKVAVIGSEQFLYTEFSQSSSGQTFVKNLFNWVISNETHSINAELNQTSKQLTIAAYSRSYSQMWIDLSFSNGTEVNNVELIGNNGSYVTTIPLGLSLDNHIITVGLKSSISSGYLKEFPIFDFPSVVENISTTTNHISSETILKPSWLENSSVPIIDRSINLTLQLIGLDANFTAKPTFLITKELEDTLDILVPPLDEIVYFSDEVPFINKTTTQQELNYSIPSDLSPGYYVYEILIWVETEKPLNYTYIISYSSQVFTIPDTEPTLSKQSSIGGYSLEVYQDIETFADIPVWSAGDSIEIFLVPEDLESGEFVIWGQILHYYLWFADRTVLDYFEVPQSDNNNSEYFGTYSVPTNAIPAKGEQFAVATTGQIFILLLFIRDDTGNYGIEVIFFTIRATSIIDPGFLILASGIIIGIGIFVFIFLSKKSLRKSGYKYPYGYPPYETPKEPPSSPWSGGFKYCFNCGKPVSPYALFCPSCGNNLKPKPDED
ncbi:MAG: S8 family serine peptidase [Candidatus Thorarchaeota archaeon]